MSENVPAKLVSDSTLPDMDEMTEVVKYVGQSFHLAIQRSVSLCELAPLAINNAEIGARADAAGHSLIMEFRTWILMGKHEAKFEDISAPATWWQHLKHDLFPNWLLGLSPVRMMTTRVVTHGEIHVCPHANVKWPAHAAHRVRIP